MSRSLISYSIPLFWVLLIKPVVSNTVQTANVTDVQDSYTEIINALNSMTVSGSILEPPLRVAFLPFKPRKGESNSQWFGNSIPSYIKDAMSEKYSIQQVKADKKDVIFNKLNKRNLTNDEKWMFTAALMSVDLIVSGYFEDIEGKDAVRMFPQIYIAGLQKTVQLEPAEAPLSSDLQSMANEYMRDIAAILAANLTVSRGTANLLSISAQTKPVLSWEKFGVFRKVPGTNVLKELDKTPKFAQMVETLTNTVQKLISAKFLVRHAFDKENADYTISGHLALPDKVSKSYFIEVEVINNVDNRKFTVQSSHRSLNKLIEEANDKVLKKLFQMRYAVAGNLFGYKGDRLVLKLNNSEVIELSDSDKYFQFRSKLSPGQMYSIEVVSTGDSTQDCAVYARNGMVLYANIDTPYVFCSHETYPVTVNVSGLLFDAVTLELNDSHGIKVSSNGKFRFEKQLDDQSSYSVTLTKQPQMSGHLCAIEGSSSGVIASAEPPNVQIKCTMQIQHELYGLLGYPLFIQPGGTSVLQPDNNFPYRNVGLSGAAYLGYRNRYLLPFKLSIGAEAGFYYGRGTADVLSPGGRIYFADATFTYWNFDFLVYSGYRFDFNHKFSIMPAAGISYSIHRAFYEGAVLYQRQIPGVSAMLFFQYSLNQKWFIESVIRSTYHTTDINYFTIYAGFGGGYRL